MDRPQLDRALTIPMDGRWVVVAALGGFFVLLGALIHQRNYDWGWDQLGIKAVRPYFADLRALIAAGDSYRRGCDPLVENPANPWHVPMDYPRAWLVPVIALGLQQSHTVVLGLLLALAFYACALGIAGRLRPWQGAVWALLLCSPPAMLAVERGNSDLIIFVLLAGALLALRRGWRPEVAYAAVGICTVLKLYPVFAFMLAWREKPRRAVDVIVAAALGFAVYLVAVRKDLLVLLSTLPQAVWMCYGSHVYFRWAVVPAERGAGLASLFAVALAALGRVRLPGLVPLSPADADGLMVGGGLYVGTFLTATNFDYRLVMLLFTVPTLLRLLGGAERFYRWLAALLLTAMVTGWWCSPGMAECFQIKEVANWTVFVGVLFLLLQCLPPLSSLRPTGGEPIWRGARLANSR